MNDAELTVTESLTRDGVDWPVTVPTQSDQVVTECIIYVWLYDCYLMMYDYVTNIIIYDWLSITISISGIYSTIVIVVYVTLKSGI